MGWTERQQAMLQEMGLHVWQPVPAAVDEAPVPASVAPGGARPAQVLPAHTRPTPVPPVALPASAEPVATTASTKPAPSLPVATPQPAALAAVDPERAAHIATLDWQPLRQAVHDCTACTLCASRTQTVFSAGVETARWMIVGEAPGEQEDLQGEPFVGVSGQLLDRMLAALQLARAPQGQQRAVYIANTLKCRPPRNRNPLPEELAQCEPFLQRQIALVKPQIILAMGRFAVQALLRSHEPLGKLRGRVHTYQGVPLVVTYHPAYLLRSPGEKARAWEDLCLAAHTAQNATNDRASPAAR